MKKIILNLSLVVAVLATACEPQATNQNSENDSGVALANATLKGDETINTSVGEVELTDSYFDTDAAERLYDEMDYQRASQS